MDYRIKPVGDSALTIIFGNSIDPGISRTVRIAREYLTSKKIDGVSDMIQLLEIACGDNRFISSYIFDTAWGKWDVMYATEGGREFAFKTLDDLWAVLNYTKPWELELVLC